MPNTYGPMLSGLRRAPLLSYEDQFQEGFPSNTGASVRQRDPSLIVDTFNRGMQSELRNRAFQAARLGETDETQALQGLMQGYQSDIDESPLTRQRGMVEATENAQLKSNLLGFTSPQEAARYERDFATKELEMPLRQAEANRATVISQAEAQNRGQLNLERERHRNFMEQLQNLGQGNRPVDAIGTTRYGSSVRFGDDPAAAGRAMPGAVGAARDISKIARAYEASKGTSDEPAFKAAYDNARNTALMSRTDVDPLLRQLAWDVTEHPALSKMDSATLQRTLLQSFGDDLADMSPEDWATFDEVLRMIRGQ